MSMRQLGGAMQLEKFHPIRTNNPIELAARVALNRIRDGGKTSAVADPEAPRPTKARLRPGLY